MFSTIFFLSQYILCLCPYFYTSNGKLADASVFSAVGVRDVVPAFSVAVAIVSSESLMLQSSLLFLTSFLLLSFLMSLAILLLLAR
jgi:hypothetical protein